MIFLFVCLFFVFFFISEVVYVRNTWTPVHVEYSDGMSLINNKRYFKKSMEVLHTILKFTVFYSSLSAQPHIRIFDNPLPRKFRLKIKWPTEKEKELNDVFMIIVIQL